MARVAVLLSLATGACHDLAIAPYAGKGTGETTLLRQMYGALSPGDVIVADALFDNYFLACELRQRGVELVARVQAERVGSETVQSRPDGDLILWRRPNKPRGMTGEQYRTYPKTLLMRQVSVDARGKNNRAEQFKVITTILDPAIDGAQIGGVYQRRWDGELDVRALKAPLQRDVLRCKSPERVRKESGTHLLTYHLVRQVRAQAALAGQATPRQLSFAGAVQTLNACRWRLAVGAAGGSARRLRAVATHVVGQGPGGVEPRAVKRRQKVKRMTRLRAQRPAELLKAQGR